MNLLDNDGRLFGVLNIVDVLVTLAVLAVVFGSIVVIGPFTRPTDSAPPNGESTPTPEIKKLYLTIDLGQYPNYIARDIKPGDVISVSNSGFNSTITDVHVTPVKKGRVSVLARVRIPADIKSYSKAGPKIYKYKGRRIRTGSSIRLITTEYSVSGTILRMEDKGAELATKRTHVVVKTVSSRRLASTIDVGDEYRVANRTVAIIISVVRYPKSENKKLLTIGLVIEAGALGGTRTFGNKPLVIGSRLRFRTANYSFGSNVIRIGSLSQQEDRTTKRIRIRVRRVPPEIVDDIKVGMTEFETGNPIARIIRKKVTPDIVILTSDDGHIYQRKHPRAKQLYLTVDVMAIKTEFGFLFHGKPLRIGKKVRLEFSSIIIKGKVTEFAGTTNRSLKNIS